MSDDHSQPSFVPSNSTNVSAAAAFIAGCVVWECSRHGLFFPAGFEAGLGGFISTIAGYFPKGGRQ